MTLRPAVCLLFTLSACSTSAPSATSMIGASGGQVTAGDSASVAIPAGALPNDTAISVTPTSASTPSGVVAVGTPYLFGPEGTQFVVPATVALAFDTSLLPAGTTAADVVIYTAPAGSTSFQPLATMVVDTGHVSASTTHFSIFVACVAIAQHDAGVPDAGLTDAGVTDAGASDAGVPDAAADLTVGVSTDSAVALVDLAQPVDLASADAGPCVPTTTGTSAVCTVSASCGGHAYQVKCVQGSICTCYVDGVAGKSSGNLGGTCTSTTGLPGWGQFGCMFP